MFTVLKKRRNYFSSCTMSLYDFLFAGNWFSCCWCSGGFFKTPLIRYYYSVNVFDCSFEAVISFYINLRASSYIKLIQSSFSLIISYRHFGFHFGCLYHDICVRFNKPYSEFMIFDLGIQYIPMIFSLCFSFTTKIWPISMLSHFHIPIYVYIRCNKPHAVLYKCMPFVLIIMVFE